MDRVGRLWVRLKAVSKEALEDFSGVDASEALDNLSGVDAPAASGGDFLSFGLGLLSNERRILGSVDSPTTSAEGLVAGS